MTAMNVTELGFLAAGALAVTAGLTAPLRPDMLPMRKAVSTSQALAASLACVAAGASLSVAAPAMLTNTPLAAVMGLSAVHAVVTAVKWRNERLGAPQRSHSRIA